MFYSRNRGDYFFSEYSLDAYLRQVTASLDAEVKGLTFEEINQGDEGQLIERLTNKYKVKAPTLDESGIDIDAKEATISVRREFGFGDESGFVDVPGLSITVRVPFSGPADLFKCRASTYSVSGTPSADVESNNVVLYYETREKDPEKIKGLWKGDISSIQQNLGWIEKDVTSHNSSLENNIKAAIAQRKKQAGENKSLIDKLKE